MDRKEAIKRLKEARNTIQPFRYVDEAIDYVVKVLEQNPFITISEIPKDYDYDCDTRDFLVYRNRYTGDEMHIKRPASLYILDQDLCSACVNREAVQRKDIGLKRNHYMVGMVNRISVQYVVEVFILIRKSRI